MISSVSRNEILMSVYSVIHTVDLLINCLGLTLKIHTNI